MDGFRCRERGHPAARREGDGRIGGSLLRPPFPHGVETVFAYVYDRGGTPPNPSICDAPRGVVRRGTVRIRWIAIDETFSPTDRTPQAILYSWRLAGRDERWSGWTPRTIADYDDLPPGDYRFEFKARDEAANVSTPCARDFPIEPGGQAK